MGDKANEYLTAQQLAEQANVGTCLIYRRANEGLIGINFGSPGQRKTWLFTQKDLEYMLSRRGQWGRPQDPDSARGRLRAKKEKEVKSEQMEMANMDSR